jgi:environmental stress-induced protein Ves
MPWANGGGITYEVAASPPGSDLASFDWRISIADVRESGPFSTFPGIDRVLTVLGPGDLRLFINSTEVLSRRHAPVDFSGDDEVRAELVDGPITDLNVMTRRGTCESDVVVQTVSGTAVLELPSLSESIIVVLAGHLTMADGESLEPRDVLFLGSPTSISGDGVIANITIRTHMHSTPTMRP